MLGLVVAGTLLRRDDRFMRSAWFLRACQWAAPLGFVAVVAGWVTIEVGRQPWTVYGLLRTADSVSPSLTGRDVMLSFIAYIVVYAIIFPGGFFVLRRILRAGMLEPKAESPVQSGRPVGPIVALPAVDGAAP